MAHLRGYPKRGGPIPYNKILQQTKCKLVIVNLRCWSTLILGWVSNRETILWWLFWAARNKGPAPSHMERPGFAPATSSNVRTVNTWPAWAAAISGVPPSCDLGSGWPPAWTSRATISVCPPLLARNSAVTPDSFLIIHYQYEDMRNNHFNYHYLRLGSAPSDRSIFTTLYFPPLAANMRGVVPSYNALQWHSVSNIGTVFLVYLISTVWINTTRI